MKRRNQNQKFSFPFFAGSPHTPRRKRNCKEIFGFVKRPEGARGALGWRWQALGACEVSPFPDSAQNAFGFRRTEGANKY